MAGMMDMMGGSAEAELPSDPLGGEMGSAEEPFEPADEFEREAADFLDETLPMAQRMMALKEAIKLCAQEDYASPESEKPAGGLALVFGDKEKKD